MTTVVDIGFGDGSLSEFQGAIGGQIKKFAGLDDGTTGKNPSIAIAIETSDGQIVIAETTWRLFTAAYYAYLGRWGDA